MDKYRILPFKKLSIFILLFLIHSLYAQQKSAQIFLPKNLSSFRFISNNTISSSKIEVSSLHQRKSLDSQNTTYWKSNGYGFFAIMHYDTISLFQSTEYCRLLWTTLIMDDPYLLMGETPAATYRYIDTLFVVDMGKDLVFYQVDSLPDVMVDSATNDPIANFEAFWYIFKENCALFTLTQTNWDSVYEEYRPKVSETTSPDTLFSIFCKMVAPLHDGHTMIMDTVNKKFYSPGIEKKHFWIDDLLIFYNNIYQRLDNQDYTYVANDYIFYGRIDKNIGYINISSMQDYKSPELELSDEEMVAMIMDTLVENFSDCKAIIVDIRKNMGGSDLVSYEIASRFNDQERVGYYRSFRSGDYDEFSEPVPVYTFTNDKNFNDKKTILLTSDHSYSAADVFAMLMKDIPTVTLMGEHTFGIFSDILAMTLPNGWIIFLSNERYFSSEGINYEQIGIYPDIEVKMDSVCFYNGTDNVLETAIEFLTESDINSIDEEPVVMKVLTNPVKEKASIKITLPVGESADLKIIDITGNVVANYPVSGAETIEWITLNHRHGVYLCVLTTEKTTQCVKLSVIR